MGIGIMRFAAFGSNVKHSMIPVLGAAGFSILGPAGRCGRGAAYREAFHSQARPVVVIHNVANGRIEVKSGRTPKSTSSPARLPTDWL